MSETVTTDPSALEEAAGLLAALDTSAGRALLGQRQVAREVVVALVAAGHVIVEGLQGLGKTLLVRALAQAIGGRFGRIQFTRALMPSDVTGHAMFDKYFAIKRAVAL
ncbi:MAG TPA: AAA family ATPase [Chromatiaceae bacterium]|nr:AAA family ATPase [Chromatiaceae bacterium]